MKPNSRILFAAAALAAVAMPSATFAEEPPPDDAVETAPAPSSAPQADLATQATDPTAPLIQLQLQNIFMPSSYNSDGYANTFVVQPVIPVHLSDDAYFQNLITRTTIPYAFTANPDGPEGRKNGLSDTTLLLNPIHKQKINDNFGFSWGPMLALGMPTATDAALGSRLWTAGPGIAVIGSANDVFAKGDALQFGFYGYNLWSYAGPDGRGDSSELSLGPLVTYHFADLFGQTGWYARWTDNLMTFDWKESGGQVASVPLGGALGKVFSIGDQTVNAFVSGNYNAPHRDGDAVWSIKLNVTLLFPE